MLLPDLRLVPLQRPDGLAFVPADDIALAFPEGAAQPQPLDPPRGGRMTVILADGRVFHRPPVHLPAPLLPLADGVFAHPRHGPRIAAEWGMSLPTLRRSRPTKSKISDVIYVKGPSCTTVAGVHRITEKDKVALAADPAFVSAGAHLVNLARLRGLRLQQSLVRLELAPDTQLVVPREVAQAIAERLGLDDLQWISPLTEEHKTMHRLGLRDFPAPLLQALAATLKRAFGNDLRLALANLVWEAFRRRGQGLGYGTDPRGFWYRPVLPVITRMGMREETVSALAFLDFLDFKDPQYTALIQVINEVVGETRLLSYHDLGFSDPRPHMRTIGSRRPEWLLAAEKNSLLTYTRQVGEAFGVSTIVLGGMPKYEDIEFLADDLRPRLAGRPLQVVSYGDFDDVGWVIADALLGQLARYGIDARLAGRLVLPERFTEEEIRLFAEPIPQVDGMRRTRVRTWLEQSGGIGGKARGLHADHLLPLDRVMRAFRDETGLAP